MSRRPIRRRGCTRSASADRGAELSGPRADGEPQRPGGPGAGHAGQHHRRARGGAGMLDLTAARGRAGAITLGADKSYQDETFVEQLRNRQCGSARRRVCAEPEVDQLADRGRARATATGSASRNASWWRRSSAGPSWTARCARSSCAACGASTGSCSWSPRRTTCGACRLCFEPRKARGAVSPEGEITASGDRTTARSCSPHAIQRPRSRSPA